MLKEMYITQVRLNELHCIFSTANNCIPYQKHISSKQTSIHLFMSFKYQRHLTQHNHTDVRNSFLCVWIYVISFKYCPLSINKMLNLGNGMQLVNGVTYLDLCS